MSDEFNGQTAIVTGAGSGVGYAVAMRLAAEGANVVIADLHQDRIDVTERDLMETGAKVLPVRCDVRQEPDIAALARSAIERFGHIDLVCNNAGIPGPKVPVPTWELTDDDWDQVFETNLRATLYMARHVVPALIKSRGRMVNTASVAGMIVWGSVVYGASKAALIQLTRGLAVELAPHGVRVNCVCPGMISTRFGEGIERSAARARHADIPLGRVAEASEIAEAIVYLASNRSSYATGAALVVDGGYSIM